MDRQPYIYGAYALNVVDGDTVDLKVDLGFRIRVDMRMRLNGINTPERGAPGWAEAKQRLTDLIWPGFYSGAVPPDLIVATRKDQGDKYGRMLATIYLPGDSRSVNQMLVDEGHAVPYGGAR